MPVLINCFNVKKGTKMCLILFCSRIIHRIVLKIDAERFILIKIARHRIPVLFISSKRFWDLLFLSSS